jgi:rSAM/selenodomain-associated transferase 1
LIGVALAIMAKAPRPGQVKTRLCPPLDPMEAAGLARAFLLDRIEQVRGLAARRAIAYAPGDARGVFEDVAPDFELFAQQGDDLGARMAAAIDHVLTGGAGAARPVSGHAATGAVLVGTDSPTVPRQLLADAMRYVATGDVDLVLGPSEDGGYYLIGLRLPRPELFVDMAWSTPAVLPETLRRAEALGLRTAMLPAWFDVDTGADLERLERELATSPGPGPRHTRAYVAGRAGPGEVCAAGARRAASR